MNKDQQLLQEAYGKIYEADIEKLAQQDPREVYDEPKDPSLGQQGQAEDDKVRDEGYEQLEKALRKFYEYGYTGSANSNAEAVNQKVVQMLKDLEVDDRDIDRFADVLMSIILGQINRGHADF